MSITARLLLMPPWEALTLILIVMSGLSLLAFLVLNRFMPLRLRLIHNEVAGFIFAAIAAIYGVLLAFVVVVVWEQYDHTRINAQHEASTALQLHYQMGILDNERALTQLRSSLLQYLGDVVDKEYPAMTRLTPEDPHPATAQGLVSLWRAAKALEPRTAQEQSLYESLLTALGELSRLRAQRLNDAWEALPDVIWVGLIVGAIITLTFAIILGTENTRTHALMIALLGGLIGLTFHVITQLDHPFVGSVHISPEAYIKVIDAITMDDAPGNPEALAPATRIP